MKERWPNLLRTSILLFLILSIRFVNGSVNIQMTAAADSTHISISTDNVISAKLLNFSPANKVLLKLQGTPEGIQQFNRSLNTLNLPQYSGIRRVRSIPIGEKGALFVIDFWNRLPFSLHIQPSEVAIKIADAPFRDPLNSWYQRGLFYHQKGELKKALAYYRKIVFQNRRHGNAYYMAGKIRLEWKQYRLAEINFRNALRGKTDSVRVYYLLAQVYEATHQPQKAQEFTRLYEQRKQTVPEVKKNQKPENRIAESKIKLATSQIQDGEELSKANQSTDSTANNVVTATTTFQWANYTLPTGIGLGIFLVVIIGIGVLRWQRKQKERKGGKSISDTFSSHSESHDMVSQNEEIIQEKKEKILALFQDAFSEDEVARSETKGIEEPQAVASTVAMEEEEVVTPQPDARDLARQLNLGVGEIELALLMSSHQVQTNRQADYRKAILHLRAQNKSIEEIARELNIGRSEVEIVLKLMNLAS